MQYFHVGGWTLTALAALLAVWALLWDRPRGRARCPRCWYDMAGAADLKCPECGRTARSPKALHRTRRRRAWAVAALALLAGAQVVRLWPQIELEGWRSTLPTSAVMHLLPFGGMDGVWGDEARRRLGRGPGRKGQFTPMALPRAERATMLRRAARGNVFARPTDERWIASYGEFLKGQSTALYGIKDDGTYVTFINDSRSLHSEDAGPEIDAALREMAAITPLLKEVRTREVWPVGIKPLVRFTVETWWPMGYSDDVTVRWSANNGAQTGENSGRMEFHLPVTLEGEVTLDLEIAIKQRGSSNKPNTPTRTLKTERRQLIYATCPSLEQAAPFVQSDDVDARVASLVVAKLSPQFMFFLDAQGLAGHGLDDVGFGAVAEIIVEGRRVADPFKVRWLGPARGCTMSGLSLTEDQRKLAHQAAAAGAATLRLRTDPEWALNVLDAKQIWMGDVEIPLGFQGGRKSTMAPPRAPPPPKPGAK
jgi:hypothetical protein